MEKEKKEEPVLKDYSTSLPVVLGH